MNREQTGVCHRGGGGGMGEIGRGDKDGQTSICKIISH